MDRGMYDVLSTVLPLNVAEAVTLVSFSAGREPMTPSTPDVRSWTIVPCTALGAISL